MSLEYLLIGSYSPNWSPRVLLTLLDVLITYTRSSVPHETPQWLASCLLNKVQRLILSLPGLLGNYSLCLPTPLFHLRALRGLAAASFSPKHPSPPSPGFSMVGPPPELKTQLKCHLVRGADLDHSVQPSSSSSCSLLHGCVSFSSQDCSVSQLFC